MSNISFTRYIKIISGVGGAALAPVGSLMARIFTSNIFAPTGTVLEFDDADSVGAYFGKSSPEYGFAEFYFGWISKSIEQAEHISFAQGNTAATPPHAIGKKTLSVLGTFTGISNGSLTLTMNGVTNVLTGMDFTACLSLAAVAAVIQAKINSETGLMWTAATVAYSTSPYNHFIITGGVAETADISVSNTVTGTDIRNLIGLTVSAVYSEGTDIKTITDILIASNNLSNNFGSFTFIDGLSNDENIEAAAWNATENNMFQYQITVTPSDAAVQSANLIGYAGTGMNLYDETTDENPLGALYAVAMPMVILAATKYDRRNAVKNYEFQMFPTVTPSVTNDVDANMYDDLRVNYMGRTQTAGVLLKFYQTGYLCGGSSAPTDMGVYANEQWLKRNIGTGLINLLLVLDQVPANKIGKSQILAVLQDSINAAIFNATISVGKTLDVNQRLYVTNVTGDPKAFHQVESIGYWVDAIIVSYIEFTVTKYKCQYTLVYAKGDSIRKIEGTDILI